MDMAQMEIQIQVQACLESLYHIGSAHGDLALRQVHFRKHQDGRLRLFNFSHSISSGPKGLLQCEEQKWVQCSDWPDVRFVQEVWD